MSELVQGLLSRRVMVRLSKHKFLVVRSGSHGHGQSNVPGHIGYIEEPQIEKFDGELTDDECVLIAKYRLLNV